MRTQLVRLRWRVDPLECINEGLMKGIEQVGEYFADGRYFLPELIQGAAAMKAALDILEPKLVGEKKREAFGKEKNLPAKLFEVYDEQEQGLKALAAKEFGGWLVVEAEQDPARATPLKYAKMARDYLREITGL